MAIELNHTIVWCRDKQASAAYLTQLLGLPPATDYEPFKVVDLANGASIDFHDTADPIAQQHYAFLVSEAEFDEIYARLTDQRIAHWDGPDCARPGFNTNDGGRGTYFCDPDGHLFEIITRPYGSGSPVG
jgi:catechol 2,3-dioxygenase-like lactoylglutathione lyase family enzyme